MKKLYIAAALIAMAIMGSAMSAHAQGTIKVPKGKKIICAVKCHGLIFIRFADGTIIEIQADASGTAELESLGSNNADGDDATEPTSTSFTPVSITVSGTDATYGDYSFSFDASRNVSNTVVTANQPGPDFPATANVYANVTGSIAGIAGTFSNSTECHMQNTNLNSFDPHVNETYTFTNDVVFSDPNAPDDDGDGVPDGASFTIPAGATVELN